MGLIAPTTLQGKLLYRETCEQKCKWDDEFPDKLSKHWQKWERGLPGQVKVPRSVPLALEPIHDIALDAFDDASGHRVGAAGTNNPEQGTNNQEQGSLDAGSFNRVDHRKGGVIRGTRVRTGKSTIERPVQFLYPMKLSCDNTDERPKAVKLNPEAPEFRTRPKREAAIAASLRIRHAVDQKDIEY